MKTKLFVIFIFLLAIFLRVYKLDTVPIELFGDELDAGYQAYSILESGKDIKGYRFPVYFHSLAESKAPVYLYSVVPFVFIFGLNTWGVRLPGVIFGLAGIAILYLLTKRLFSDKAAIFSLIVITILPWHLQYSRASLEETLLMALLVAGIYFFYLSLSKVNFLYLSVLFFSLVVYTYPTGVLLAPLFFASLIYIFKKKILKIEKKVIVFCLLLVFLFSAPFLYGFFASGQSQERFSSISIFSDTKSIEAIINKRIPGFREERVFHNKLTQYGKVFFSNYLISFSPQYLFINGDPLPRHNSGQGELLWVFAPFLALGVFEIIKNIKDKNYQFLFVWLLLSPVPSALTSDGANHAGRLFVMVAPLVICIALGLCKLFDGQSLRSRVLKLLTLSFVMTNFVFYLHQYYVHYPQDSWQYWQYGYRQVFSYLREIDSQYEKVVINNNHDPTLLRFLFWNKIDPNWFHQNFLNDQTIKGILPGFNGFKVGKYYFGSLENKNDLQSFLDSRTLYLAFQEDEVPGDWNWEEKPPQGIKVLKVINKPMANSPPYIYLLTADEK